MSDQEEIDFGKLFNIATPSDLDKSIPILVVEDQQDLRLIIVHQLQKLQFTKVKQAANGYEALEILAETREISAIVCDMTMPVLGGMEFLAELRERTDLVRPPFALSMESVSKEKLMLAVESGVDEILVKPFSLKDIYPKLYVAWKKFHNPKNPEKAYELAKQNLREKNWNESEKIYQLLADSAKKSARPVVGLARVSIGKGDFPKALEHLADAELRNKSYVHIFSIRGEIFAKMKKFDEALKCFEHAISLSPLNPVRYKAAADILMACQRFKEAVSLLEAAVKSGLEFKELFNHLSYAYFMMKDFPKALRYVKSALGLDPDNVTFLNQMGICLKNLNQMEEAAKVYNQIIKLDPNNVAALYNKASLCEAKNDVPEAIKLLERAVKKDPSFAQATSKLQDLKKRTPPIAS